ncbi:APC family permease [Occallatibacter riparius]|uniref:APC family permease n=1 Tax=Occallatibacter riparius TaxID=1002689 RepID=A0A9J7BQU5_9BACT|nr:APC family permease [Occallatibacter riparius]UWZ85056.1 APC family permease [Occallatibacter riparius]
MASTYGLQAGALDPMQTLAQSVSAVSPTTGSSLTVPLVFALAGNGTWLVYLLATGSILLVAWCISRFARTSASPGSLYSYASDSLPPVFGAAVGWGLLLAYVATGASVAGGAMYYAILLGAQFLHLSFAPVPTLAVICAVAGYIAYRDIKLSAGVMLWIEFVTLAVILTVLAALLIHTGFHIDADQVRLKGLHFGAMGPALVLAIFTFVGFESATTLGVEARQPLRTIPRAVLQCAVLAGMFFMLCSYAEVVGFRGLTSSLSDASSPMNILADRAGLPAFGLVMEIGAMVSNFACVLACTTAAARVLLRMARSGLVPEFMQRTSARRNSPTAATVLASLFMFVGTTGMALCNVTGYEMYDLAGSLAVFGFLTAYALVAVAVPFATRENGQISRLAAVISPATVLVMVLITVLDIRSSADAAHARIPYLFLGYLAVGFAIYFSRRRQHQWLPETVVEPES